MIDIRSIGYKFTANQFLALKIYSQTGNKAEAYRQAYNPDPKLSSSSIGKMANSLFKSKYMALAVQMINEEAIKLVNAKMNDMVIDKAWVLQRAALLASFNIRKFIEIDANGQAVYNFKNATDDDWYCISEYTVDEIQKGSGDDTFFVDRVKIKTVDKLKALELVGRHVSVQAFKDNISVDGNITQVNMSAEEYKQARAEALKEDDC